MSGPPFPRGPVAGSNGIGSFIIGKSPIGSIIPFDMWSTVISQYADSPILTTLISNWLQYIDQTTNIDAFFDDIWNITTAHGYGLDVWGRIVGVTRTLTVQTGRFFGFEEQGITVDPFGQSPFFAGTPATQNFNLSDDAFRTLIYAKALANITNGSIPSINQILLNLFPHRGNAFVTEPTSTTNIFLQSNSFTTSPWLDLSMIFTPNVGISPDLTNDAWTVQRVSNLISNNFFQQVITKPAQALVYTFSAYAKPNNANFLALYVDGNDGNYIEITYNLATGVISNGPSVFAGPLPFTPISQSIKPAASGYYRCTMTFKTNIINAIRIAITPNANNALLLDNDSQNNSSIFIFGAQLEQSDNAGPYVPTSAAPASSSSGPNMTMTYTFNFQLTSVENAIVSNSGVLPRPVGVSASVVQL